MARVLQYVDSFRAARSRSRRDGGRQGDATGGERRARGLTRPDREAAAASALHAARSTTLELAADDLRERRTLHSSSDACFAPAEQASEVDGPARLALVASGRVPEVVSDARLPSSVAGLCWPSLRSQRPACVGGWSGQQAVGAEQDGGLCGEVGARAELPPRAQTVNQRLISGRAARAFDRA